MLSAPLRIVFSSDPKAQIRRRIESLRWTENHKLARAETLGAEAKKAYDEGIAAQNERLELENELYGMGE